MAEESFLNWANKQPSWTRDALRRHAVGGTRSLAASDKDEILARVRHHSGMTTDPAPDCVHLNASHLGAPLSSSKEATLVSFGPVENLNRLAAGQQLKFALDGVTVIYGDNGSGKSGYARIAKKLCRSITPADLLGNVFDKEAKPPAKVKVRYRMFGNDDVIETDWVDGTSPPDDLAEISVFDSANARFYVDEENRISFLPRDIALLQSHVEHCVEMDAIFDTEIKALDKQLKTALPGGYTSGGAVAILLANLDSKAKQPLPTIEEIKAAAVWSDEDAVKLQELEKLLANDPALVAARCRRAKATLENYVALIAAVESLLSPDAAKRLDELRAQEHLTAEAAAVAATNQFASAPLGGVGQSVWRLMYDHAKAYAASLDAGINKLPDTEGDHCLMCQEPLSSEAAQRMRGFNDFVAGQATKAADAARIALETVTKTISNLQIPTGKTAEIALAEYGGISELRKMAAAALMTYCATAIARRDALLKAVSTEEFAAVPALAATPIQAVTDEVAALEAEAVELEKAVKEDDGRKAERTLVAQMQDRKKLFNDLATILARRDNLDQVAKLKKCKEEVKREYISRKITSLRRSTVMADLEKRIKDEIKAFDLMHIPFQVNDRSDDGESLFGVVLDAPNDVPNNKVLSEGEQRALALACFLGEATGHIAKHGLIIDDPVSSLDHIRLRRVAERLVEEAEKGRQIIIFTHNIHFFNEVVDAAAKAEPQVPLLKNFIRSSGNETFGLISEIDEPWIIMPVTKRIATLRERLKSFANIADFNTEDWRAKAKEFYTDLRETWERLVEEVLLGKVVERFNTDVKTQSLKGVVVEDADYKTIFFATKRVSERSGHDMASGRNLPTPKPTDMKTDLDEIEAFRLTSKKKQDAAGDRRKLLEQPPEAKVA